MKVRYFSDLHFEFHADAGRSFVHSLSPLDADLVVLAGDIAVGEGIGPALDLLCERFTDVPVVYVHGNHEFYGTTRDQVLAITRAACERNSNLNWLDCDAVELAGTRILGAPLWFPNSGPAERLKAAMNDFQTIQGFESWVYLENARALAFLDRELIPGSLVVTHHLPVRASVAPPFEDSPLNPFFLCDVEALVRARRPSLWIHGHTHTSLDLTVGATRVVCNPFGYVRVEENRQFRSDATAEVETMSVLLGGT